MTRERPLILIVDDDPGIRGSLAAALDAASFQTVVARDGIDGVRLAAIEDPDLILTDLAMPNADGFSLITTIRRTKRTPIIVLSVRGGESDKIRALDLGADDYVVKPFSLPELLARVRASLRRSAAPLPSSLEFPGLRIDLARRRVIVGDREVHLTPTEFALLTLFALEAGRPVSVAAIIESVWEGAPGTTADTVRVHVSSLRRKIEPDPSNPRYLVTEPWIGYRFLEEPI